MPSIKKLLAKPYAAFIRKRIHQWADKPVEAQERVFRQLIYKAKNTAFGRDHQFDAIQSYDDFKSRVPVRDYEGLKHYVEAVKKGEEDVLWPGKPLYFAKTSGTTSGAKYIPITKDSMPTHIEAARNAILMYIAETGRAEFVDGKMIFLQGSPELSEENGIKIGRLSGIVAHYVPNYLQKNRMPSWETNCISDWETKVDAIIDETIEENMTVISGIPSWVQMYFERIVERKGQPVASVFKNFSLFIYGGVNFEPYRMRFRQLIGRDVDSIELFPASEGFFAFQDSLKEEGMLLQLNSGIFYEFIRADEFYDQNPRRMMITDVEPGINYVLIVSTTAGLWGYNVGDTIMFTSTNPYRVKVTGRIKHFISAFGEHVIAKEVEQAMREACEAKDVAIREFTVAPQVNPATGLPYHEWFVEFENTPADKEQLAIHIDNALQKQNSYYFDLISGHILRTLQIRPVKKGGFEQYMRSIGKLGGQNKLPRLANDRKIADALADMDLLI